jgi:hypothetical protein
MEVDLPATVRRWGQGCGGRFAHGGGVGRARGRGLYAGEDAVDAHDERAAEVGCRRPPVEMRDRAVGIVIPATARWR